MPTYNTPDKFLRECLDSVLIQSYEKWELCIADDCSTSKTVVNTIQEYISKDERIKLFKRKTNGHISLATNSAIDIAQGEFIALLDHDDLLWPNALYEVVRAINKNPKVDLIYSDEDKVDESGINHTYPFFKPEWSPEFLESCNYITHFSCARRELITQIGSFRKGYEGAQDWDLFIRLGEKTNNIIHIPKILYSWRIHQDSTAHDTDNKPYVYKSQRNLLKDHIKRINHPGTVRQGIIKQHSTIDFDINGNPLVSVILLGYTSLSINKALEALIESTGYDNFEIIILSWLNLKIDKTGVKTFKLGKNIISEAEAYNIGIKNAQGTFILITNDNLRSISKGWLKLMLGDAQRPNIGVVGVKSIDISKQIIRHAGIAIGIQGLFVNLLDGVRNDDNHYTRGLYSKSRRNISAVSGLCMMFKRSKYDEVNGFNKKIGQLYDVDFCLNVLESGSRNIYSPNIEVIDTTDRSKIKPDNASINYFKKRWNKYINLDPYYNPNFTIENSRMEPRL
ncbi:MAG: hypothetical protein NVS1B13_25400 [Flavisolibacter sp.]